jgi:hypothetical protein
MLESLQQIKDFMEWCKQNKVKSFKNSNIQFELSDLAFIEHIEPNIPTLDLEQQQEQSKYVESQQNMTDDDLLFYSSNG